MAVVPEGVKRIGSKAFGSCGALVAASIPESVEELGDTLFDGCVNFETLIFKNANGALLKKLSPQSVKALRVGERTAGLTAEVLAAFTRTETFSVPQGNPRYACDGTRALFSKDKTKLLRYPPMRTATVYEAPATLTEIDETAFAFARHLQVIDLSKTSVRTVGKKAFSWCVNLERVIFPKTLTKIEDYAFEACPMVSEVVYHGAAPVMGRDVFTDATPEITYERGENDEPKTSGRDTQVAVPYAWLDTYRLVEEATPEAYEAAAARTAANGSPVWQCYVEGTDPTDVSDTFSATIEFVDGKPVVHWSPALNGEGVKEGIRTYTVWGKKTLADTDWTEVKDGDEGKYSFFKVTVGM